MSRTLFRRAVVQGVNQGSEDAVVFATVFGRASDKGDGQGPKKAPEGSAAMEAGDVGYCTQDH